MDDSRLEQLAQAISHLCGWLYFMAWSLSFYPQIILNVQRRTTQGLTPDFPLLNVFGFSCYTVTTTMFLYSDVIREQYAVRHPLSPTPTVRINDLAFGLHACILSLIVYSQFWPRLWGWKDRDGVRQHANKVSLGLIWGGILAITITLGIVFASGNARNNANGRDWAWIDVVYAASYFKLLLTVFKYVPQAIANFRRRSTIGWSITQQLLDFSGGILSLLQLIIDSALQADWSGITGNPMKLGLANISLLFDIVFITQHFVLFGPVEHAQSPAAIVNSSSEPRETETSPLLAAAR